jgi:cytochrome c oxidase subunit 5b
VDRARVRADASAPGLLAARARPARRPRGSATRLDATRLEPIPARVKSPPTGPLFVVRDPIGSSSVFQTLSRRRAHHLPNPSRFPERENAQTHETRTRCFATFPGDDKPALDIEHATGLELKELQAMAEGKDFFDHYAFLKAPNGTKEAPVVVTSSMPYRIVGATDPDDDSIVHWGRVEAGKPPIKIGEEWFVHKAE